ncbi:MAG: dihydrofolate reductase [Dysgonamonadaceae bacterium]|jgi:dihydrofolate reductase|nr:dihydrofolate reductase [Dysgonamonadaceae bacterium]
MNNKTINLIVAADENNAIGYKGGLLCYLPNDLRYFKRITDGHTVVMGRRTFESLPKGALPNRKNIVVTAADAEKFPGCTVVRSLDEALQQHDDGSEIFVIGGGQLYCTAFPAADVLYLTRVHHTFAEADTFFPEIDFSQWELVGRENHEADEKHKYAYTFLTYKRIK